MNRKMFVVFAALVTLAVTGCDKSSTSPTPLPSSASVQPTIKSAGDAITPTPLLSTFTFRRVADSSAPSSSLGLWDLRFRSSPDAVRMRAFCGTGVTGPAAENPGLRGSRKPAFPMKYLVDSRHFSREEIESFKLYLPELQNELGVPLTLEAGVTAPFSKTPGVINVFHNPSYDGFVAASTHVEGGLIIAGDIFIGSKGGVITKGSFIHESGHAVVGLCHHNDPGAMSGIPTLNFRFSVPELDDIEMLRRLVPDTSFSGASSSASSTFTMAFDDCGRR